MSIRSALVILFSAATFVATSLPAAYAGGTVGLARSSATLQKRTLREGNNTLAPFAFIRYCVSNPNACRPSGTGSVDWSNDTKSLVVAVNQRVNRSIRPVNDKQDEWRSGVKAGDCEDFALTKRESLLKAGIPASALRIAVARTAEGEGHAVLIVKTSEGDFVLDNRTNQMLAWHKTDLTFIKIATAEDPRLWRWLL